MKEPLETDKATLAVEHGALRLRVVEPTGDERLAAIFSPSQEEFLSRLFDSLPRQDANNLLDILASINKNGFSDGKYEGKQAVRNALFRNLERAMSP